MLKASFTANTTDEEYKDALTLLATSSQHLDQIPEIIKNHILTKLQRKRNVLDVGSGNGELLKSIAPNFQSATAVEVNSEMGQYFADENIILQVTDFCNFATNETFDLVLCVHALYHYTQQQISEFIQKLMSLISNEGCCMISLAAPRGQLHLFHTDINPNYTSSEHIQKCLDQMNIKYERLQTTNVLKTNSKVRMSNLLKFFATEDCLDAPRKSSQNDIDTVIKKYVEESDQDGDVFAVSQEEDHFIIFQP